MTQLENKFKNISLFLLAICVLGCKQKSENKLANYGYINSRTFSEYLDAYKGDSLKVKKIDINYFEKLELQDFIYGDSSKRFIVYLFAGFNSDSTYTYKVKEIDGKFNTCIKGFRESKLLRDTLNTKNAKFLDENIQIPEQSINSLFVKLDSIKEIRKEKVMFDYKYDDPFRVLLYFDGKEFYRFNNQLLPVAILNNIDSFIRLGLFTTIK